MVIFYPEDNIFLSHLHNPVVADDKLSVVPALLPLSPIRLRLKLRAQ